MDRSMPRDPAERRLSLRYFYRDWRPTRLGRLANAAARFMTDLGLAPPVSAVLEVRGRATGKLYATPVVVTPFDGGEYLVSMLGTQSSWVKNVEAAEGAAILRQRGRRPIKLVSVPPAARAPILQAYVHVATSGRHHFPVAVDAPLSEFEALADRYPVYRIEPADSQQTAHGKSSRRMQASAVPRTTARSRPQPGV